MLLVGGGCCFCRCYPCYGPCVQNERLEKTQDDFRCCFSVVCWWTFFFSLSLALSSSSWLFLLRCGLIFWFLLLTNAFSCSLSFRSVAVSVHEKHVFRDSTSSVHCQDCQSEPFSFLDKDSWTRQHSLGHIGTLQHHVQHDSSHDYHCYCYCYYYQWSLTLASCSVHWHRPTGHASL